MKTNLLYLLALLFILTGCSLATEDDPEPEKKYLLQRKLSEITFESGGGMIIDLTYSYNEKDQLTRIGGVLIRDTIEQAVNTTLQYDSQGRVMQVQNNRGTSWTNTFNDKNQLIEQTRAYKNSEPAVYRNAYNEANQLQEVKIYRRQDRIEVLRSAARYTYTNENSINIVYTGASGEKLREYNILTDQHKRELPVLPHQIAPDFSYSELFNEGIFTTHNIIRSEVIFNPTRIAGRDYQSRYSYNEGGHPATCVKIFEHGSIERITYTYSIK